MYLNVTLAVTLSNIILVFFFIIVDGINRLDLLNAVQNGLKPAATFFNVSVF